ncbi:hypothetical protein Y032_0687g1535 [Ancylostoma ceylanicum]|uniref:Uncharacterized protein n=1 Tax=Ancylostoma ceylanicum TaxID=53326 RepID=A0A016WGZ0_9BILA|nr:hypothetical protein Y032_0687g1535 [Ancylostoma ceylanicum]
MNYSTCYLLLSDWMGLIQGTSIMSATLAAAKSTRRGRDNTQHPRRSPAPRGCCVPRSGNRDWRSLYAL